MLLPEDQREKIRISSEPSTVSTYKRRNAHSYRLWSGPHQLRIRDKPPFRIKTSDNKAVKGLFLSNAMAWMLRCDTVTGTAVDGLAFG
jgi:hypothetical protein